ncbi:Transposon Ty3-G Gag-Pol polyprotein like [Argiope bruennichi]|uniref:RNA-directed DNA polymerase n=1 Tax=Argiope bruennichi TaxID=94029 RepID=A0A8T0EU93_ARGBR|nr:Transposon Ty3-G Gag-Pol polyprotein like [Argiope bruennichi]
MVFLARATREDLITLGTELGETLGSKETKVTLKDVILKSVNSDEEKCVKELLLAIAEERKARVEEEKVKAKAETEEKERSKRLELEFEERKRKDEIEFELQKLRLQHNTSLSQTSTGSSSEPLGSRPKWDLQTLIHRFDPSNNDISHYLILFERQAQNAEVPKEFWASHLIGCYQRYAKTVWAEEVAQDSTIKRNYEMVRQNLRKEPSSTAKKWPISKNKINCQNQETRHQEKVGNQKTRPAIYCYGCSESGYIKAKCPTCSPSEQRDRIVLNFLTLQATSSPLALLDQGVTFRPTSITMTLANGCQTKEAVCTSSVTFKIEKKVLTLDLLALPKAKGNRTLLGADFLVKAGIVLNLKHKNWHFYGDQTRKIPFREDTPVSLLRPVETVPDPEFFLPVDPVRYETESDACQEPDASPNELCTTQISEVVQLQNSRLEEEGEGLTKLQLSRLKYLLMEYQDTVNPGGEPTPYIEHRIDTGSAPPVATTPYRMSPAQQEILKKELKSLLDSGIIEECDSQYASPVVLITKPNGEFRLCMDYTKLNAVTKSDPYPLPRMDDLLHKTSETKYMSTIDLKSGYHRVKIYTPDMDKTAFICPFGVYRFTRMPFGLKTVPATFQRLIDLFRNGLKDISPRSGIEVDPVKVSAIMDIPPPKNVKQLQSFFQTCSWCRRFIPNFAGVAKPLSTRTRKRATWTWSSEEQNSFDALKKSLID